MGLVRVPKKISARSTVHDLSFIHDNQTILSHHLNDLLRDSNPSYDTIAPFQNFGSIPMTNDLDLERMIQIYSDQYMLVENAYHIGVERRLQAMNYQHRHRRLLPPSPSLPSAVRRMRSMSLTSAQDGAVDGDDGEGAEIDVEERYQHVSAMAARRKSPMRLREEIDCRVRECKVGDIIDICGYRGTGYYFVVETSLESDFQLEPSSAACIYTTQDGSFAIKAVRTSGRFGCHLPSESWPYVEQYGFEFFAMADVWGCYLPIGTRVRQCQSIDHLNHEVLLSWLQAKEDLELNGNKYYGELFRFDRT